MTLNCSISRKVTASLALIGLFLSTSTALVPCKADEVTCRRDCCSAERA